jgi:hypothetical protein
MIRIIVSALVKRLKEIFPDKYVYDEFTKQNLKEPCFYINVISSEIKKEIDRRYKFRVSLDISYFNGKHNENKNNDFFIVTQKFYEEVEVLEAGTEKYRIAEKRHRVVDDVLHFLIDLELGLRKGKAVEPFMQTLIEEARLKDV